MKGTTVSETPTGADASLLFRSGEPTDHDLITSARAGSQRSVEILLDRYRAFVHYKARRYFIPGAEEEDLLQEAMVGLFNAIRDFDLELDGGRHPFMAFADICIERQIHTAVKKANRLKHKVLEDAARLDAGSHLSDGDDHPLMAHLKTRPSEDPCKMVEAADQIDRVRSYLMGALTQVESDVVTLLLKGKTYNEMAAILGLRLKGIDNALQRARKKLKAFLEADRANAEFGSGSTSSERPKKRVAT